jgi:hypothetical protein
MPEIAPADGAGRLGGGLDDREGSPPATQQQAEFEIQPTQKFNLQPSPLLSLQLIFQDSSLPPVTLILEEGQPEACYLLCRAK